MINLLKKYHFRDENGSPLENCIDYQQMLRELSEIGKLKEKLAAAYIRISGKENHASDCATSCAPGETPGPCDCDE